MTPEQFRDCRTELRKFRKLDRCLSLDLSIPIKTYLSVIRRHVLDLPEFRAMVEAKRSVREAQTLVDRVRVGASIITTEAVAQSRWGDRHLEYREAREKFLERIGGGG